MKNVNCFIVKCVASGLIVAGLVPAAMGKTPAASKGCIAQPVTVIGDAVAELPPDMPYLPICPVVPLPPPIEPLYPIIPVMPAPPLIIAPAVPCAPAAIGSSDLADGSEMERPVMPVEKDPVIQPTRPHVDPQDLAFSGDDDGCDHLPSGGKTGPTNPVGHNGGIGELADGDTTPAVQAGQDQGQKDLEDFSQTSGGKIA
jgi:hypothetical protein